MFGGLGYLNKLGASGGLVFSPGQLFSGGEQGAWYDPSDNTTMFQDSTGTTPVTAVEQAVGLILDKSKGLVIGSELFSNQAGTFDNTSGGATATYTSATQTVSVTVAGTLTSYPRLTIDLGLTVGRTYLVSGRIDGTRTGIFGIRLATLGSANDLSYNNSTGVFQGRVAAGATSIQFLHDGTVTGSRNIALLSVREIAGNHAYQSTSASRPTLRARYNRITRSEEFNNADWQKVGAGTGSAPVVTANDAVAPDGTTTADLIVFNRGAGNAVGDQSYIVQTPTVVTGTYTQYIWLKAATGDDVGKQLGLRNVGGAGYGVVTLTANWVRYTRTETGSSANWELNNRGTITTGNSVSAHVWGADFRSANDTNIPYQRIAAATDYATGAAFPQYLAFDGTDDSLLTANVDFATVTSDGQARRNLLLNPTQFDVGAVWVPSNSSVTANATTAPDGTTTADKLLDNAVTAGHFLTQSVTLTAATHTYSIYVKRAERNWCVVYSGGANVGAYFDLLNGVVGSSFVGAPTSTSIQDVGNGWFRCSITFTAVASSTVRIYTATADGLATYTGDGTSGIFLWGAQLETGSTATAFQNIGTDKMTVFSGLSKLSDAAVGAVVELSATSGGANNGSFMLSSAGQASAGAKYGSTLRGTSLIYSDTPASYASPISNVITLQSDIDLATAALEQTMRINASNVTLTTVGANAGVGNFGTYPLFIGRRNNANFPFNGRIYSLIIRGAASNTTQVAQTEKWVANKTPLGTV